MHVSQLKIRVLACFFVLSTVSLLSACSRTSDNEEHESDVSSTPLVWKKANLTNYTSYPDAGSEECLEYNGCTWAGMFAALSEQQSERWVQENNIIAVHSKDFDRYKLKTLRLRQGSRQIDAKVYDMCSDSDCDGCCTKNSKSTGFLIDIERYTAERFKVEDGVVQWACVDCQI